MANKEIIIEIDPDLEKVISHKTQGRAEEIRNQEVLQEKIGIQRIETDHTTETGPMTDQMDPGTITLIEIQIEIEALRIQIETEIEIILSLEITEATPEIIEVTQETTEATLEIIEEIQEVTAIVPAIAIEEILKEDQIDPGIDIEIDPVLIIEEIIRKTEEITLEEDHLIIMEDDLEAQAIEEIRQEIEENSAKDVLRKIRIKIMNAENIRIQHHSYAKNVIVVFIGKIVVACQQHQANLQTDSPVIEKTNRSVRP